MARTNSNWGHVRPLPSGGYQASYRHAGTTVQAPATFASEEEAQDFLSLMRSALGRGGWSLDEEVGVALRDYAERWMKEHTNLRPRTRDLYRSELKLHILPVLGEMDIGTIDVDDVRAWRQQMVDNGRPGPPTIAKCYRLLHAILNTAVLTGVIARNPCTISGAGHEQAPDRPVASITDVFRLAEAIDPRFRAAVLLATFGSLRIGEILALRRRSFDLQDSPRPCVPDDHEPFEVTVVDQLLELDDGSVLLGPPKTRAGQRSVALPAAILPDIEHHLLRHTAPEGSAFLFSGGSGNVARRAAFFAAWDEARRKTRLEHLHFHDLRHTGNTYAAATGASIKELMARMGHATPRAAVHYQHALRARDRAIAEVLDDMIRSARRRPPDIDLKAG